jgi:hypothetical protein
MPDQEVPATLRRAAMLLRTHSIPDKSRHAQKSRAGKHSPQRRSTRVSEPRRLHAASVPVRLIFSPLPSAKKGAAGASIVAGRPQLARDQLIVVCGLTGTLSSFLRQRPRQMIPAIAANANIHV